MLTVYKLWNQYRDHIPKRSRVLSDRIEERFVHTLEFLFIASYQNKAEKLPTIERALSGVDILKFLLMAAWETHLMDEKKYTALSVALDEAGRQVGGWKRGLSTEKKTP